MKSLSLLILMLSASSAFAQLPPSTSTEDAEMICWDSQHNENAFAFKLTAPQKIWQTMVSADQSQVAPEGFEGQVLKWEANAASITFEAQVITAVSGVLDTGKKTLAVSLNYDGTKMDMEMVCRELL